MRFADRQHAGELLAEAVAEQRPEAPVVIGLPRGGVPVAAAVARLLDCPLDVLAVAKVGLPTQPELALGAVSDAGLVVRNEALLSDVGLTDHQFDQLADTARERLDTDWRDGRSMVAVHGKTAILCDDGVATGATARLGIEVLRSLGSESVWLAIPVAPRDFACSADRTIVLERPRRFVAVGKWYDDFTQTSDSEVKTLLQRARLR